LIFLRSFADPSAAAAGHSINRVQSVFLKFLPFSWKKRRGSSFIYLKKIIKKKKEKKKGKKMRGLASVISS